MLVIEFVDSLRSIWSLERFYCCYTSFSALFYAGFIAIVLSQRVSETIDSIIKREKGLDLNFWVPVYAWCYNRNTVEFQSKWGFDEKTVTFITTCLWFCYRVRSLILLFACQIFSCWLFLQILERSSVFYFVF